ENRAGIRGIREGRAGEADDVHGAGNARRLERDVNGPHVDVVGAREGGAGRQLRDDDQVAAIDGRDKAGRRLAELIEAAGQDTDIDAQLEEGEAYEAPCEPLVAGREPIEAAVEKTEEAADRPLPETRPLFAVRLEQQGAQCR